MQACEVRQCESDQQTSRASRLRAALLYDASMATDLRPAWVFSAGSFIAEELSGRGWTRRELAERMGGDVDVNHCALDLVIELESTEMELGEDMAAGLERAFGASAQFWLNADKAWRESDADQRDHSWKRASIAE